MVAANPHGAGGSKELPRLLFPLLRGLTSSGTSRLLTIRYWVNLVAVGIPRT